MGYYPYGVDIKKLNPALYRIELFVLRMSFRFETISVPCSGRTHLQLSVCGSVSMCLSGSSLTPVDFIGTDFVSCSAREWCNLSKNLKDHQN